MLIQCTEGERQNKTYSSRDSHVVTHRSTNLPYVWQSGRDAQFSADCGRTCLNRFLMRISTCCHDAQQLLFHRVGLGLKYSNRIQLGHSFLLHERISKLAILMDIICLKLSNTKIRLTVRLARIFATRLTHVLNIGISAGPTAYCKTVLCRPDPLTPTALESFAKSHPNVLSTTRVKVRSMLDLVKGFNGGS
jgi:hypothetical protein